ncbi:hypothetical protein [Micromonospora sp. SL4-19]|uniref:hypothetical protein n=1 Tax=Micromonospora sp. SL4-19 TaxID=3399129 RepID=UPI003A4DF8ED
MRDRGLRTSIAVLVGLAVIYFGATGHRSNGGEGSGVSGGVVLIAVLAALLVYYLTRPAAK